MLVEMRIDWSDFSRPGARSIRREVNGSRFAMRLSIDGAGFCDLDVFEGRASSARFGQIPVKLGLGPEIPAALGLGDLSCVKETRMTNGEKIQAVEMAMKVDREQRVGSSSRLLPAQTADVSDQMDFQGYLTMKNFDGKVDQGIENEVGFQSDEFDSIYNNSGAVDKGMESVHLQLPSIVDVLTNNKAAFFGVVEHALQQDNACGRKLFIINELFELTHKVFHCYKNDFEAELHGFTALKVVLNFGSKQKCEVEKIKLTRTFKTSSVRIILFDVLRSKLIKIGRKWSHTASIT
ncbi:hypothetical protein L484_016854 [Morus notabilis]|uniref:Uncharacterized protein n=1 Tax=Morus notabilis TaxID=981085 RepID=W9QPC7_9ROSA|nr:hypothetical protein L484_016854 [Morus notabilis]